MAQAGLYGLFAPETEGGLGLGYPGMCSVVEELSSGCLASTFVWAQHFRFLGAMLEQAYPGPLRERYLRRGHCRRSQRGGRPAPGCCPGRPGSWPARRPGGWRLEGEAPWVSGWGIVDVIVVLARGPDGRVCLLLLDAKPQPGLSVTAGGGAGTGEGGMGALCAASRPGWAETIAPNKRPTAQGRILVGMECFGNLNLTRARSHETVRKTAVAAAQKWRLPVSRCFKVAARFLNPVYRIGLSFGLRSGWAVLRFRNRYPYTFGWRLGALAGPAHR